MALAATLYVDANSLNSTPPYDSWATAAAVIQDAVDVAQAGDTVLVTNGLYATGGRALNGLLTSRVLVSQPILLASVNGPAVTTILGRQVSGTTNGFGAVRCVYLADGAVLTGLTLQNGATLTTWGYDTEQSGGGVWCASTNTVVTNCVLNGNSAAGAGGGAYGGTLNNCVVTANSITTTNGRGGGVAFCTANNCTLTANWARAIGGFGSLYGSGGGAAMATLNNCTIRSNSAAGGGGAYYGTLLNCTLSTNSANGGGGAFNSTMTNCVVSGNSANGGGGTSGGTLFNCTLSGNSASGGGGASGGTLFNCTLSGNSAPGGGGGASYATLYNCTLTNNTANGPYGYGGGAYSGTLSNCTLIRNAAGLGGGAYNATLTNCLFSGNTATNGGGAYYGQLYNCTLTGNSAPTPNGEGGGAYYGSLYNCTLSGNSAGGGGAVAFCTVNNCALYGNSGGGGGGAYYGTLNNCTVTGNSSSSAGGGAFSSTLNNCILFYNTALFGENYDIDSTLNYSCTTPLPGKGLGNISADPQLADPSHLSAGSPCRGAGSAAYASGLDIDGEAWASPPSIGCDEYRPGGLTGSLSVGLVPGYTNVAVGFSVPFTAQILGHASASRWEFGDGIIVSNRPYTSHAWAAAGDYVVVLRAFNETQAAGVSASVTVRVVTQPVHFVSAASLNPLVPYSSWATAAANIQAAVDIASVPGALVLVTNGVYRTGGRVVNGLLTNRVAITKPLMVASVNGPTATAITGNQVPGNLNGDAAVRCAYLADGATLAGFTLNNGATRAAGDYFREQSGGAIWCASHNAVVTNCVLRGNSANGTGGGAYGANLEKCNLTGNSLLSDSGGAAAYCRLNNCTLTGNSAPFGGGTFRCTLNGCSLQNNSVNSSGGGAAYSILNDCTLTGNSATGSFGSGGGAFYSTLNNCIAYYNSARLYGDNYESLSALNYCCTTPLPGTGLGNISDEPQLADLSHLSAGSPCIAAGGAAYAVGLDIDGDAWANPPSIGCDEYRPGGLSGPLSVAFVPAYTQVAVGFAVQFTAQIQGQAGASRWDFGDGTVVSNRPYTSHAWAAAGDYVVVLMAFNNDQPGGVSTTVTVHVVSQPIHYVSAAALSPLAPYNSWATAAATIQDAVDAASVPGALVLVTNGVYSTGGRAVTGLLTSRVAVMSPLVIASVNGPALTVVAGSQVPGTQNGDGAVRCLFLADGATLNGFSLTNGATRAAGDPYLEQSGGGVCCASPNAIVSNCVLNGNSASYAGAGVSDGTVINCTLSGNSAFTAADGSGRGGGASDATLTHCVLSDNVAGTAGGSSGGTLNRCILSNNWSRGYGGAASGGVLNSCLLIGNSSSAASGGGVSYGVLNDCTLSGNTSPYAGGGAFRATLNNCSVYYNTAYSAAPQYANQDSDSVLNYCCTTPQPTNGFGNFTNEPLFLNRNGNLRLQTNSPCINSGNNAYATLNVDLDGNPRIVGGTVDIGAYEFQNPGSIISYAWLQSYHLPTDGSADYADPDHDGMNNWQEWSAGTDPTNPTSVLRVLSAVPLGANVIVTWESVAGVSYFIERATDLAGPPPVFSPVATSIPGQAGMTTFTDTTAAGTGPFFYRVCVQ
jgi:hypothetical protein